MTAVKFSNTGVSKILACRHIFYEPVEHLYDYRYCSPNLRPLLEGPWLVFSSYVDSQAFKILVVHIFLFRFIITSLIMFSIFSIIPFGHSF